MTVNELRDILANMNPKTEIKVMQGNSIYDCKRENELLVKDVEYGVESIFLLVSK